MFQFHPTFSQQADFSAYVFPEPQYLGAKHQFVSWITRYIPSDVSVVFDGFGGSQSIAFALKKMGMEVHTNDLMRFCHQTGQALIENKNVLLTPQDVESLFAENAQRGTLMQSLFEGVFFDHQDSVLLDRFRANVRTLPCPYQQALALCVMNRALTRKIIMGRTPST